MSSDRPEPEPTWTIRTAIADITPTRPQALFGYAARDEVAAEAAAPLEANIIILPAPSGNHVVVVALDTLFAGPDLVDDLHQALGSRDLPPVDDIIAIASHTHTGASIDRSKPRLGAFDPDHLREVVERIVDAIATAFARPARPVDTVVHSTAPCRRNIRRRRKAWGFDTAQRRIRRTIWTRPSTGAVRHELDLVQLRGADGNAAVLWSWPCHPVNVAGSGLFDPDFPGVVRDAIRGLFDDQELSVVYLPGFAGDLRADETSFTSNWKQAVLTPGIAHFARNSEQRFWRLCGDITAAVESAARAPTATSEFGPVEVARSSISLDLVLANTGDTDRTLDLAALRMPGFEIGLLSAEVCEPYYDLLPKGALYSGYYGDCFGYLPADQQIPEGGYEVDGFCELFSLEGRYAAPVQQIIVDAVAALGLGQDTRSS